MRLDKYLKVSRIIKRRTVAKEAGEGGRVTINGKVAKPSSEVKEGDVLEIRFGDKLARYKVVSIAETVRKNEASLMYEVLDGETDL
ncbi:MAG: RNA-binding S4 domain-containing protein [Clostridia bacterium]|nr:RNA-binding S4 domain-containing protein [Clostridia bacterium]